MVLIKNDYWNYSTGELYKSYMNQHQAETILVCYDKHSSPLKVHGLILAANSQWFELVLKGQYNQEIPLPYKRNIIKPLINIIYKGVVDVEPSLVPDILKVASSLKIRGLDINNLNSLIKREVPQEPPLFITSPDRSVISPVFDFPNDTGSNVARLVKNPFAESKVAGLLKEDNDSDKTNIGSDDDVLVIDNGVNSDIDVVMVDDGSPLTKDQTTEKPQSNGTELSAPKIVKIESNDTKVPLKRKLDESRPITPPSPEVDVEALPSENPCIQSEQRHTRIDTLDVPCNSRNVNDKLTSLLELMNTKIESRLKPEIKDKILNGRLRELTQLCVICCKFYSNFMIHKNKHRPTMARTKGLHKCRKCSRKFKMKGLFLVHSCV